MKRSFWTADQVTELRALYPDLLAAEVAVRIGRPVGAIYQKATALGLTKSDAFKASDLSGRVRRGHQNPSMIGSRFQKGQPSWTKGTKGIVGVQEGCRATQFKPGRAASEARNYLPIGSLRVSKDGYLERKLSDDPSIYPARRWVSVHRAVWEAAHGPIPHGHIVAFQPGKKTAVEAEVTADRLECISRAENARRNHPRSKSPELARLVQLKGAITRQVNRIAREAQEQAQ